MSGKFRMDNVTCTWETEGALKIEAEELDEPLWIPKQLVDDDSEVWSMSDGENKGTLVMPEWFAEEKGLL
jgi:hypothetical protein